MKTLGILGGFGPLATAHFYRRLVALTPAAGDEDHLPVVLLSRPDVPSRLRHLEGAGPSPLPALRRMVDDAVRAGADVLCIPSSTVHAYFGELEAASPVPILHLPTIVCREARTRGRRVALMATTPTVRLGLYAEAAAAQGIDLLVPDDPTQAAIMRVVEAVKAGRDLASGGRDLAALADRPWAAGADTVVLGCTELPVIHDAASGGGNWVSATDALARAAIAACSVPSGPDAGPAPSPEDR